MEKKWMMYLMGPVLVICMTACMTENLAGRGASEGGKGTEPLAVAARQPIGSTEGVTYISTLAQLRAMTTTGNYKLNKNIDASPTSTTPFAPIGFIKDPFHGTLDCSTFTIDKLNIKGTGENTGLFSWAAPRRFAKSGFPATI